MDKSQAQFVLRSCRPGSVDLADPVFTKALDTAAHDEELSAWFEVEQQLDRAITTRLKEIPVPPNLAESILRGLEAETEPPARRNFLAPLALAASIAALASIALFWMLHRNPTEDFARCRQDLVSRLESRLVLNFQSERAEDLQRWLADRRGLADSVIPAGLQGRRTVGCRSWTWNGQPAGLICFVLEGGQAVHLFVVPNRAVPAAPGSGAPRFEQVGAWQTASWTQGELVYVLAGKTDRDTLAKLL